MSARFDAKVIEPIANRIHGASIEFAKRSVEIETAHSSPLPWALDDETPEHRAARNRLQEYVAGTGIMSVAGLEAAVNELFSDAAGWFPRESRPRNVTTDGWRKMGELWGSHGVGSLSRKPLIEKCQTILRESGLDALDKSQRPTQDVHALIKLRDGLVHAKPAVSRSGPSVVQTEQNSLERVLKGRFPRSQLVPEQTVLPFIWSGCLGGGCARWVVRTAIEFENLLHSRLGISVSAEVPEWARK